MHLERVRGEEHGQQKQAREQSRGAEVAPGKMEGQQQWERKQEQHPLRLERVQGEEHGQQKQAWEQGRQSRGAQGAPGRMGGQQQQREWGQHDQQQHQQCQVHPWAGPSCLQQVARQAGEWEIIEGEAGRCPALQHHWWWRVCRPSAFVLKTM